ncbi:methylosome subunit pICln-like [Sycon ciliatum]|uniref:methylosome subunit pICln-like n=1 Tax=Sycon ciliatum TaxID=27933 RepID=UPI0020ABC828|eukprot:scpid23910/ scgid7834/ Methylosome subunit pICln; Chloride channel, nucleotide sensitive 1A; Chloride conductance regulatory protein ICln
MANVDGADSDVVHHEANTKAIIGSDDLGVGDLYICKSCVRWKSSYENKAFTLQYKSVGLHAVSRNGSSFPMPCLYCMVGARVSAATNGDAATNAAPNRREVNVVEMSDEGAEAAATAAVAAAGSDDEGDWEDDDEDEETTEVRFAPEEPDHLDSMYSAMSQCQAMHPDTDDDEDEQHQLGEGNDSILMENISSMEGFFTSADDVVHLTAEGQRVLEHLNAVTVEAPANGDDEPAEDGQFDDA